MTNYESANPDISGRDVLTDWTIVAAVVAVFLLV